MCVRSTKKIKILVLVFTLTFIILYVVRVRALTIKTTLAQINDPYVPQGTPESIKIPWLTMIIISSVIIAYGVSIYRDSFPSLSIFKTTNNNTGVHLVLKETKFNPITELMELEGPIPRYIPAKPQTLELEKVSWITKRNLEKLNQVNIYDTYQLLEVGSTQEGISRIHSETGLPQTLIHQLISYANLMRVQDINHLNAERLYWLGIDSVDTLSSCDATSLSNRLKKNFNGYGHQGTPTESIISAWIQIANSFTLSNLLKDLYLIQEL